jgi:hypothetical protein
VANDKKKGSNFENNKVESEYQVGQTKENGIEGTVPGRKFPAFHKFFCTQDIIGIITAGAYFDIKKVYSQNDSQKQGNIEYTRKIFTEGVFPKVKRSTGRGIYPAGFWFGLGLLGNVFPCILWYGMFF